MTVIGVIAEYNPFHNGHAYHLSRIRERYPDAGIVCVMSGNFTQRGEPAVLPKHIRAAMAVCGGADLVLELPVSYACAPAEVFARGGIGLLASVGLVDIVSFGSECGELPLLCNAAAEQSDDQRFRTLLASGASYAEARSASVSEATARILGNPNDLLAVEYLRAMRIRMPCCSAYPVRRVGASHDDDSVKDGVCSASLLRGILRSGGDWNGYVPESSAPLLSEAIHKGLCPVDPAALDLAMLAAVRRMEPKELQRLPEVSEGLEYRIAAEAQNAVSMAELVDRLKTKRYSHARLRRCMVHAYLGLFREYQAMRPTYLRVLAASSRGTELLRQMKQTASLPVITKPASLNDLTGDALALSKMEAKADNLYALAMPDPTQRTGNTFYTTSPYIM